MPGCKSSKTAWTNRTDGGNVTKGTICWDSSFSDKFVKGCGAKSKPYWQWFNSGPPDVPPHGQIEDMTSDHAIDEPNEPTHAAAMMPPGGIATAAD